jgi:nickel/cobalt transporter (NicO) family protein
LSSALLLGFIHGLGADHLMAIAALSVAPGTRTPAAQRARAIGVAMRFAAGHALLLALGAGAFIALGWSIPAVVDRGGEMAGGVLLIVLGAVALGGMAAGRVYGHSHVHGHEPAPHWHLHIGRRDHHPRAAAHSHLPTMLGAAFAVSSLRALVALAPFGGHAIARPLPVLLGLIVVFAAGILLSMSLFGVALARMMTVRVVARLGQGAAGLMGVSSIALGVFWILR